MLITTTSIVEGRPVQRHLGIVTGEVILGANIVRDFFAAVTDIFGGRSGKYEEVLARGREQALRELEDKARAFGANAVIGVDIDYETIGARGSMLMVSVTGTAVVL
ncbi:MAG: hypothetical protein B7X90_10415 [Novosphingobium sp. 17-62-19]|uniref:heavy metal-binding domain-containing protein n=1 Tax=Novosphingobium sp. 17-62-19 TaxID=1970406 RepID=UPI000BD3C02E|nr:heavy metal-binding domain-containing protein [Novosphingobium sp. 17-62-19]OYX93542.1 MAG: hypothetical protein B7Y74_09395 [Novosphingobium sp. 35-62-5]OZA18939.1 MAG: hypothetical protein B7X90_10415 [Novosphingobium sp. 17-62-19]HQS95002.1 heavy metal-binding domain-containing protein [Novosphingobium sp.]